MDKDAKEKSDAVSQALLAELEHDAKKNAMKGGDHSKQSQDKSKDKKKNRDNRKSKDPKVKHSQAWSSLFISSYGVPFIFLISI